MAEKDKTPATMEDLLVSRFAAADAVAKLLIEKGIITEKKFMTSSPLSEACINGS
jgi:hypothetical protein